MRIGGGAGSGSSGSGDVGSAGKHASSSARRNRFSVRSQMLRFRAGAAQQVLAWSMICCVASRLLMALAWHDDILDWASAGVYEQSIFPVRRVGTCRYRTVLGDSQLQSRPVAERMVTLLITEIRITRITLVLRVAVLRVFILCAREWEVRWRSGWRRNRSDPIKTCKSVSRVHKMSAGCQQPTRRAITEQPTRGACAQ